MKVRVKFRKYGPVRFIGHLDVMRFFQKCIRRAEIDVAYTTGFSPHQIMSFAAPLGVGLTSDGEYMDIECNSVTTSRDMVDRFNRASVPGIEIVNVVLLPEDAGNAMASVAAAGYTVRFREGREPSFDYLEKLPAFFAQPEILITKETKKNTLTVDIRLGIYELQADMENRSIYMLVDASSSGNIKPQQIMDAYAAWQGETLTENAFTVHRRDTYLNLASAGQPRQLAPMDAIGRQILAPVVDEKRIQIAQEADRRKAEAAAQAQRMRQEALTAKELEQQWLQSQRRSRGEVTQETGHILTNEKIFQFPHSACRIIGQHALCGKENLIVSQYNQEQTKKAEMTSGIDMAEGKG